MLRKILLSFLFITMGVTAWSQTEHAQKSLGVNAGYVTRNESMVAGLSFSYCFSSHLRLNPEIDYIFKHESQDAAIFNIDMEMPYGLGTSHFHIYPLFGFSYSSWNHHYSVPDGDSNQRTTRLGLNLGGGLEYYFKPTMKLMVEGKCNLVKHLSTGLFTVGVAYLF